ncbi:hypothetical protein MSG28_007007 [Choristoneura fumiferana]|uniref:Uncharacterized protein n=1 Tax=Choristoneura fumiferana TaxID=7141 RepID=A0ACC0JM61_CHOFU|nr:hypothetical protein MSG28_007007 [Choristoneura fumiferana]
MESEVVSSYFSRENENQRASNEISDDFLHLVDELNNSLENIKLPRAIECIYNPTLYARQTFEIYIRKYCNTKKDIMYFGMNPGPWGMSQTGVPFGEIKSVRDWLGIDGPVNKPLNEIKNRPVQGFQCTRTEVSGKRFWGVIKEICGTPDNFFKTSFVYNYLPQQWMKNSGCNLTPGDFKYTILTTYSTLGDKMLAWNYASLILAKNVLPQTKPLEGTPTPN